MTNIFDKLNFNELKQIYNYFQILLNILTLNPPKNEDSLNNLSILWNEKIQPIKDIYRTKNAIYNIIIKIKNLLTNGILNKNNRISNFLSNIISEKDKEDINNSKLDSEENKTIFKASNMGKMLQHNVTLNYCTQLTIPHFKYEDEIEDINIKYKQEKIQYISIDLLIKKLCEDNSFNFEVVVNKENNQTYNFINAFIYQCFGFISYELLINKLLGAHNYYTKMKKMTSKINKRIIHLIFKITKYLWDHECYNCSYFQSSDDLKNNLKKFLNNNNMTDQIKPMLDYKKDCSNKIDLINNKDKNVKLILEQSSFNYPEGAFEFNIFKYNEKDIALVITYISIKNFKKLYEHLYELNPSIKKNDKDKPHISAIINFSNKLTNFFIEEVFSYDLLNVRVNVVEKIIYILTELRKFRNFNDLISVYSALISIKFRLQKTWNIIESKFKTKIDEFNNLCNFQECYKNIKEKQYKYNKENKFYIPLLNITSKHINFYDEGCKYVDKKGLVCIEKIIVNQNEIEGLKNELRPLRSSEKISKLIRNNKELNQLKIIFENLNPKDLETLENLSEKLEPDFTLYKKPDKRKRKTKTDAFINSN
jgi:hypothetical protein